MVQVELNNMYTNIGTNNRSEKFSQIFHRWTTVPKRMALFHESN